jgi:toxin secretion/phage lysis holin
MDKNYILLKSYGAILILGLLSEIFIGMYTSVIIILVFIILDTITGIAAALKYKIFSSAGLRKFIRKVVTYALCMITVRLLEVILNPIIVTTMLSKTIIAYLAMTESVSILENLAMLGVPLPPNILIILIKNLNIPIINTMMENSKNMEKEFSDIDYIVKSQIDNLTDIYMIYYLEIRYDACKSIIRKIMRIDENNKNSDILLYKVVSFAELAFNNVNKEYAEKNIPTNYIEYFSVNNQSTIVVLLKKLNITCCSEKTTREKKDEIIEEIIIIIYQSIIFSRKSI